MQSATLPCRCQSACQKLMQGATADHTWLVACFGCMHRDISCLADPPRAPHVWPHGLILCNATHSCLAYPLRAPHVGCMIWLHATSHLVLPGPFSRFRPFRHIFDMWSTPNMLYARFDALNVFNKLLMNPNLTEYISRASGFSKKFIIPKLGFSSNFEFSRRASISSCLLPVLLDSPPDSDLLCLQHNI